MDLRVSIGNDGIRLNLIPPRWSTQMPLGLAVVIWEKESRFRFVSGSPLRKIRIPGAKFHLFIHQYGDGPGCLGNS